MYVHIYTYIYFFSFLAFSISCVLYFSQSKIDRWVSSKENNESKNRGDLCYCCRLFCVAAMKRPIGISLSATNDTGTPRVTACNPRANCYRLQTNVSVRVSIRAHDSLDAKVLFPFQFGRERYPLRSDNAKLCSRSLISLPAGPLKLCTTMWSMQLMQRISDFHFVRLSVSYVSFL